MLDTLVMLMTHNNTLLNRIVKNQSIRSSLVV